MEKHFGEYLISDDKSMIQGTRVYELLLTTPWASKRSMETMQKAIENSLCFGVYKDGVQIAFGRCVTDNATMFWLADVIVDEKYRGQGLGKEFLQFILGHKDIAHLRGILFTSDAHELYERYGFVREQEIVMLRHPAAI